MSKMQLALWQRLGSLATAVLMMPIAALVPPAVVKASPPLTQPGTACRGTAMLEPNDPDVQALRSLIQKYNISITYPADDIGDRPLTRREFSYALRSVLFSVRQKLIDGKTILPSGDLLLVERLSE